MNRVFRKYHRLLAIILFLPLLLTALTGMLVTTTEEWSLNLGISRSLLLKIHTGEILHLQAIYPVLNGLGMIGLLVTGIILSKLFRKSPFSARS